MPDAKSSQLVLKYMLVNRHLFVKSYHNRVYSYSSGSKFKDVAEPLVKWLDQQKKRRRRDPTLPNEKRTLKLLNDVFNLHRIVGDVIISFIKAKPQPFLSNALKVLGLGLGFNPGEYTHTSFHLHTHYNTTQSKDHFWSIIHPFKPCMTFVFLVRFVLGYKSQHQWRKFSVSVVLYVMYIFSISPQIIYSVKTSNST